EELKEIRSLSRTGISTITLELKDQVYAVDEVWSRIRDKIDDAKPQLPAEALEPDFELLEVSAYAVILALVWDQPGEPNYAVLRRRAEALEDVLRGIGGTRDVDTYGAPREEIVVQVRQESLAAIGLSAEDVARQLKASDAKVTAGVLRTEDGNLSMEIGGELDTLDRIRRTPIAAGDGGRIVVVGDVGDVTKGVVKPLDRQALVDGKPAIALGALVQANRRIDHWDDAMRDAVDDFEQTLPTGIRLKVVFQQNQYVESRLDSLLNNLIVGAAAVVAVIWFMMGWRSALVVGTALPLASLMVLAGMRFLGIPMHQMSITGLIIALGLLIDNAIVMVDEVRGRIAGGSTQRDAVASSVRHLAVPLTGSTVTTALSFAPIALMPGPAGEFVGSIAVSVILAVVSSLILALTITPSLMAILAASASRRSDRWWNNGFSNPRLASRYSRTLNYLFGRPALGVAVAVLLPIAGFVGATTLTEQFFPPADRNQFQIQVTLPSQTALGATAELALETRRRIMERPEVSDVEWFIG
ncbi:MAG: efflux RND transporter permease subunit, partial [Planctomycetota bacterium]